MSIVSRLRLETAAHRLEFDAGQQDAAGRLDELRAKLWEQTQSVGYKLRSQLRRLSAQPEETPLRGVYLWGGVGRGKTNECDYTGTNTAFHLLIHADLRPADSLYQDSHVQGVMTSYDIVLR